MRTIGVVTGSRSDYGCLVPILREIEKSPELRLRLLVTGTHLKEEFGLTFREIEADGFEIHDRVELALTSDAPEGIAESMGAAVTGFSRSFAKCRPDLLLLLGDRFEICAAAFAALPFKIPVAHVHGGELSRGAMDDALRHSITKLSHLHCVATEEYAKRVLQMGEESWRVIVSGAPSLDQLRTVQLLSKEELAKRLQVSLDPPPLLVTYHPVTLEYERTPWQIQELLKALEELEIPLIFTAPNADTSSHLIRQELQAFVKRHPDTASYFPHLGTLLYFSLMRESSAMVGNSSSGLVEAPSFGLPVVNIGTRQEGRIHPVNVIDVGYEKESIVSGVKKALSPEFRESLRGLVNPYGDGLASHRIVRFLAEVPLNEELLLKRFVDQGIRVPQAISRCLILGGGGHARVLIDTLKESQVAQPAAILDADRSLWGKELYGVPIPGGDDLLDAMLREGIRFFVVGLGSVGDNGPRKRLFELGTRAGFKPLTVQHPSATVSPGAIVGEGSVIFAKAVVNAGAALGRNVIVNTGAIIEHDCVLGDHVHVATGARLAGAVRVGEEAHIGVGAVVRQGISIGEGALVGAGAVVVKDVAPWALVMGVPAKPAKELEPLGKEVAG